MSYQQDLGLAPGETPTNAEKAAQQLAYMQAHPELYQFDDAAQRWTKRAPAPIKAKATWRWTRANSFLAGAGAFVVVAAIALSLRKKGRR